MNSVEVVFNELFDDQAEHLLRKYNIKIMDVVVRGIRFPTSVALESSDGRNPDPDYSVAYVILKTNSSHCGNAV